MSFFMSAGVLVSDFLRDINKQTDKECSIDSFQNEMRAALDTDYDGFDIAEAQ